MRSSKSCSWVTQLVTLVLVLAVPFLSWNAPAWAQSERVEPGTPPGPQTPVLSQTDTPPISHPGQAWPQWFQVGFQYRGRAERPTGVGYGDAAADGYYLNRVRLEATLTPLPWLTLYAQGQDSRAFSYADPTKPASFYNDFDIRQTYADLHSQWSDDRSLAFRFGRQELNYGSRRLVGAATDWSNANRTFEAAAVTYAWPGTVANLFVARPLTLTSSDFDRHAEGEYLYGLYTRWENWVPQAKFEPYFMWKRLDHVTGETGSTGEAEIYTVGMRWLGKTPSGLDYTVEVAAQRGSYASDDISAWAGNYGVGWTVPNSTLKPRLLVEYSHASGNTSSSDGKQGTFDQLYPANHPYYGIADQVGWKNMHDARLGMEFCPRKQLKVQTDYHQFWLATVNDGLYNAGGSLVVLNPSADSRHVGHEFDLQLAYTASPQLSIEAGWAYLMPGQYLKQSTGGNSYSLPYLMWVLKF